MLDKTIQYISNEAENEAGQKTNGVWYCKSLKFKDAADLKEKGIQVNQVLNELNNNEKIRFKTKEEKKK